MIGGVGRWFVHTITVETFEGAGAYGNVYAAPVTLAPPNGVWVDGKSKLVLNSGGVEVISETSLATSNANAPLFTPDSRVTINGVVSLVIKTNAGDSGSLNLPTDHVEVNLT